MVKSKALPDSARLSAPPSSHSLSLSLSLSLPLTDLALSRLVSHVFFLSPKLFIQRVPPGSCRGWTPAYFCFINYVKAFDCVDQNKLLENSQKMGIPEHFSCLLRNLYEGQEATVITRHGTSDWF